jgi:hypothetical protein
MDLDVFAEVDKWVKKEKKQPEDFLFTNKKGDPYFDCSSLNKTLKRYCR